MLEWALKHRKSVIAIALVSFFASFAIVPLVGTEFIPETDEGFISLRLNTPVGSSLEYTDGKVQQVEAMLKVVPEIALAMTTVGSEEGRNYARVNLRLVERKDRTRSQKEIERAIRDAAEAGAGIELAFGFDRPVWVNLLGPDPETLTTLITEFAQKVAKVPGIAGSGDLGEGGARRRCRFASTTTPPPTSASPCSRWDRRSDRCSPAIPSATGSRRTARTTRSTCSCPKDNRRSPPT